MDFKHYLPERWSKEETEFFPLNEEVVETHIVYGLEWNEEATVQSQEIQMVLKIGYKTRLKTIQDDKYGTWWVSNEILNVNYVEWVWIALYVKKALKWRFSTYS